MSKFNLIIEGMLTRYQGTNFLVGDRVKFIGSFLQHEWAKKQAEIKLERLKQLIESGDNIRISAIKTDRPVTAQTGHFEAVDGFYVDVIREKAPGLFMPQEVYTVPQELLELQEDYPNLAGDTPKGQVREDDTNIKPKDIEPDDGDQTRKKQTRCEHPAKEMPTSHDKLPNTPEPTDGESYTKRYIED